MDKISVIIPVYNRIGVLERSVNSVCMQTYPDVEIILVDDGSEDGSDKLCFEMAQKDSRIHAFSISHRGASAARNEGLKQATGKYITFLDSDDLISTDMLQKMFDDIKYTGADIACCSFRLEKYPTDGFESIPGEVRVVEPYKAFEKMLVNKESIGYGVSTGTKLIKRELIFQPYPLYFHEDMVFGEDTLWVADVLERCSCVAMDDSIMMIYSCDCENSICRNIPIAERLKHNRWKIRYLTEHGSDDRLVELFQREESILFTKAMFA